MKVLDLGCHDGFVGKWLRERYDGDLHIDGVELHPDACEIARGRGYGKVVQCMAEDAWQHFGIGSYDIVVIYEVLEHVPDMDGLLEAAETMCKPDGRILVSTPDGCFGAGHNPHHLRALRSIDVADLLRRRGRLNDVAVGSDGVTIASYTPGHRRSDIAIYCGPTHPWSPTDIADKGLGGSETAAVRLAAELSDLGFVVTVYGEVEQGCVRDVIYRHWTVYDPMDRRLATIASRMPEVFDRPNGSKVRLLWLHDTDVGDRLTSARADKIDHVLTLSKWHADHVRDRYPFLAQPTGEWKVERDGLRNLVHAPGRVRLLGKVVQTRNGVHLPLFAPEDGVTIERDPRVLYTSSPDRGLDILLEMWPKIRERVPDAELAHCYPPYFDQAADVIPEIGRFRDRLRELADQPGVVNLGSLPQPAVADAMRAAMVWTHPSWCTPFDMPFHETSCIGAMEAQAAGLHVVASDWGALRETVEAGHLIAGPRSEKWEQAFIDSIVAGLTDVAMSKLAERMGPIAMADKGWNGVAVDVAKVIDQTATAGYVEGLA